MSELKGASLAEAADVELDYALAKDECAPAHVKHSARALGFSPGLWFKLAMILGTLVAKVKALASGKPLVQSFKIAGLDWWVAVGEGQPPVIPGA